jgi:hypothetical protein
MTIDSVGIWVAALLTLFIYSFLYKDNALYKFAENIFVGVSAGYLGARLYYDVVMRKLYQPLFAPDPGHLADYWLIIPTILSVMMLLKIVPNSYTWLSRWSLAFVVGTGVGLMIVTYLVSNGLMQVAATINAFNGFADATLGAQLNAIILAIGVVTGLIYFFFSKEHKGLIFGSCSRIGVYFLMVSFGAAFGYTVMARISLLIGRLQFLLFDWLKITL